jgi:hypothetical protein
MELHLASALQVLTGSVTTSAHSAIVGLDAQPTTNENIMIHINLNIFSNPLPFIGQGWLNLNGLGWLKLYKLKCKFGGFECLVVDFFIRPNRRGWAVSLIKS